VNIVTFKSRLGVT